MIYWRYIISLYVISIGTALWGQVPEPTSMNWESLIEVVETYQNRGEYTKSYPYVVQMKTLAITRYEQKGWQYATVLRRLADAIDALGNWEESKQVKEELLAVVERLDASKGTRYALVLAELAYTELQLKHYKRSEQLCWEVKSVRIQNPINQKYYPLQVYTQSIDDLKNKEERRRAYKEYLEAKVVEITNLNTLAFTYKAMGDYEAYSIMNAAALQSTSDMVRYVLGQSAGVIPANVIADMRKLFRIFENFENYVNGEKLYLQTLDWTRGSDLFPPLARNLAFMYRKTGELTGAKMLYIILLQHAEDLYGSESVAFARALVDLADLYMDIKDTSEAAKLYLKAKSIVLRLEGRDSELYQEIDKALKHVYRTSQQRNY